MDLNIFNVLDELEDMMQNSKRVLGKVLLDEEALLEYLDKLRTLLPEEVHQAKWLSKERDRLITGSSSGGGTDFERCSGRGQTDG